MRLNGYVVNKDHKTEAYKVASSYRGSLSYEYVEEKSFGYYLIGDNQSYLVQLEKPQKGIAVLKDTDEVQERLTQFFNAVYSSKNSFMDFYIGIKNEDYSDMINYYKVAKTIDTNSSYPYIGLYVALNRISTYEKPIVTLSAEVLISQINRLKKVAGDQLVVSEEINNLTGGKLVYSLDFYNLDNEAKTLMMTAGPTDKLFRDILENNVPIKDAVAEYRKFLDKEKVLERIDKLNSR